MKYVDKEDVSWDKDVEKLQELIDQHDRIVFFGGAGVSTESGIPDFGVWTVCIIRNMIIRRRPF